MHCVDCHFSQDVARQRPHLRRGRGGGRDRLRGLPRHRRRATRRCAPPARRRRRGGTRPAAAAHARRPRAASSGATASSIQRSALDPELEWEVSLVKDTSTPGIPHYNEKAARAKLMTRGTEHAQAWGRTCPQDELAHGDDKMACYTCHMSWTTSCGGCHLPIQANWKTERHALRRRRDAQLRDLQPAGRARRHVQLGRHGAVKGGKIAPVRSSSALVLVLDQRQPRAHLHPAAADRGERLLSSRRSRRTTRTPSARPRPRPAPTATSRRRTTTTRSWRSCCCTAPTSSTSSASTPGSATSDTCRGGAGHRVGRAAGGDRQLPAPLRLSRLVRDAREARAASCRRRTTTGTRGPRSSCLAAARRVPLRRRRAAAACASTTSPASPTRASRSASSPRRSRRSGTTRTSHRRTRPAWRCRPTSRSTRARNQGELMRVDQPGAAVPPDLQLRADHRRGGRLILTDVNTLAGRRAAQQLPQARAHLEPGRRARRRAAHHLGGHYAYVATPTRASSIVDLDDPLKPKRRRASCRSTRRARRRRCSSATCSSTDRDGPAGRRRHRCPSKPRRRATRRDAARRRAAASTSRAPTPTSRRAARAS